MGPQNVPMKQASRPCLAIGPLGALAMVGPEAPLLQCPCEPSCSHSAQPPSLCPRMGLPPTWSLSGVGIYSPGPAFPPLFLMLFMCLVFHPRPGQPTRSLCYLGTAHQSPQPFPSGFIPPFSLRPGWQLCRRDGPWTFSSERPL